MVPYKSIPTGWQWLYWLSFITYTIKALMINEVYSLTWSCNPGETLIPGVLDVCQLSDGHSALQLYDMDASEESYKWKLLGYIVCFWIVWNILGIWALLRIDHSNSDTGESPNWDESTIKGKGRKHNNDDIDPALAAALKPAPAFISWANLSYSVDIPKNKIGAAAAKKEAKEQAELEASQMEMVEVKKAPTVVIDTEIEIPDKPLKKTLLQDVYGYAKPGMMVALMGGSGAGKTTLLDVLAGKKTGGDIINGPLINGKPRDLSFNRIAGYVEQFDSHDETATVREAITFSAMLRLPSEMTYEMKMAKVDTVIQTLRLGHVQNQQIGNAEKGGISPELRKKVTIGVELVMDPGMLFLDEPTTGLDSAGALAVMHAVRKLSDKISVICTIHQPSIEIVNCFTHVLLLNKWRERGRVAYFGPLNGMAPYFKESGLGEFEEGKNLAEFGLESLKQAERKGVNAAKLFVESPQGKQANDDIKNGIMTKADGPSREYTLFAASFVRQVIELTQRFFANYYRDKLTLYSRIGVLTFIGFVIGTLYYQSNYDQLGAVNRISLAYIAVSFPSFSALGRLPSLVNNRLLYFREKNSATYSPLAYYTGRVLGDQPFILFEVLLYCSILYWTAGMRSDDGGSHFGLFLFTIWLVRQAGFATTELIGGLVPSEEAGVSAIQSIWVTFQLFCGFLIRRTAIPDGWIWMHYLSSFKYPIGNFTFAFSKLPLVCLY
jgi:ABC-type multidrug transport system ATPase subunit/ABC-type multidrug transport system permease subunit